MNLTKEQLDALISQAEEQAEMDSVIGTSQLADRILTRKSIPRVLLPWSSLHGNFDLRPGELTVWAGDNGSGKSLIVGQVVGWLLPQGARALIASMEMWPEETVARLIKQCAGVKPSDGFVRKFCDWAEGKLWIYDQLDTIASERILKMINAVVRKLGVHHVVIDSMVKCGVAQDGDGALTKQTHFVDKLQRLAKSLPVHIHLIAHTRKPERDGARVTKYDIRGASQITDLADNVVLLQRNREKELAKQVPPEMRTDAQTAAMGRPDSMLIVAKQRHHSWEGVLGLRFNQEIEQFIRYSSGRDKMPWPNAEEVEPWRAS